MRKIIFILLLISFYSVRVHAQDQTYVQDTAYTDTDDYDDEETTGSGFAKDVKGDTTLFFRQFTDAGDTVSQLKKKKEFEYMQYLQKMLQNKELQTEEETSPSNGSGGKARRSTSRQQREGSSGFGIPSGGASSPVFTVIIWIIGGLVVLFILYNLFLNRGIFRGSTTARKEEPDAVQLPENIADGDYEALLRRAYLLGDWRMASRYLFLKTLQRLDQKELIVFSADKTNSDYLYEMPEAKRNEFSALSLYYEYIWYGNMKIEKEVFDKIESRFNQFLNKL